MRKLIVLPVVLLALAGCGPYMVESPTPAPQSPPTTIQAAK